MKSIRIFALVLFACIFCNAANFTSTHGKLKVEGGKIKNKNNQEVVLRGMSFFWHQWNEGSQFYTQAVVNSLANNWNVSVIRAALTISGGTQIAKSMMDWANSAGVYVIIDNHSHDAHNNAQSAQNFFREVSAYVKDKGYTHVIYELYNEPIDPTTWAQIKSYAEGVIDVIRQNDPDGLIVVGTTNYSAGVSGARANPITGTRAKNVLYTLHFYAGSPAHNNYKAQLKGAYCNDFPVFVTEWGTSTADGNGSINTTNSNDWISLLEAAKVSHANWSLTNKNESSAALTSTNVDGGLTASGTYVKNLFKLNTGSSLANVGLTQQTIDCSSTEPIVPEPDGIIEFGQGDRLANFKSKNGADSIVTDNGAGLVNTSASFTAEYILTKIPRPGEYLISFYVSSSQSGKVSWSGSGISSGEAEINTGSINTYQFTDQQVITIDESPETPLNLSFEMPSPNTLRALRVLVRAARDSADSVKYNIGQPPDTTIVALVKDLTGGKTWKYDAITRSFVFEANNTGTLSIYNLRGERKALFSANGHVSLRDLPAGAYLAVYRRGSELNRKTIYLK